MSQQLPVQDFVVHLRPPPPEALACARADFLAVQRLQNTSTSLAEMGRRLWDLAFPTAADNDAFAKALAARGRLRLWLRPGSPDLAALPWEYLCLSDQALRACRQHELDISPHQPYTTLPHPDTFVALNPKILILREVGPERGQALREPIGPLKVLIAWANPRNACWPDIAGAEEEANAVKRILEGLGASQVTVDVLPAASRERLTAKLEAFQPRVLHFVGHGAFPYRGPDDPGGEPAEDPVPLPGPALVLEGRHTARQRRHDYLAAQDLRALCRGAGVRVVMLNCCWGGRSDPHVTGLAQALTTPADGWAVPVVVAMQCPIPQATALLVSDWLYRALTVGSSFEYALQQFRSDYIGSHDLGDGFWGIPVLYASVASTVLFERPGLAPDAGDPYAELVREAASFVGRQFLRDAIQGFLKERDSGMFLLTAPAGLGKSAFLVNWVDQRGSRARFFYRYWGHDSPLACARALYAALHERRCPGLPFDPPNEIREAPAKLDALLQEVSRRLPAGETEVLVIDGLDEAAGARPADAVPLPERLPRGLYVLLAARPEWLQGRPVPSTVQHYALVPESPENLADAGQYIAEQLAYREVRLPPALTGKFIQQVAGNFLIIKIVCDMLPADIAEAQAERVFAGIHSLADAYRVYWDRLGEQIGAEELRIVDDLLALMLAALAPVTEEQLAAILGGPPQSCQRGLSHVRRFLATALVPGEAVTYRFFHASFREFVAGRTREAATALQRRWAEYCLGWRKLDGYARVYALRHLPSHLIAVSRDT
jgi:hypothetical protein